MENYNSMSFTPEEVEQGLHTKLIKYLLDYNKNCEKHYNDIHITTDGYCLIVEWTNLPYDHAWGGRFEYLEENEYKVHYFSLPDETSISSVDKNEDKEIVEDFIEKHPGWTYNWSSETWNKK